MLSSLHAIRDARASASLGAVPEKLIVDLLCYITVPLMFVYGVKSYSSNSQLYGLSLFAFAGLIIASCMAYSFFGHWKFHRNFLLVSYTGLYFYLLISGGEEGTGIYWLYAYPLIIFAALDLYVGALIVAAILTSTFCILFIPEWLNVELVYSINTKIRFCGSLLFVSVMAYIMERARVAASLAHHKVSEALEDLARTDELTGLLNRRGVAERIESELARAERDKQEMSVVICDVDHFKKINDHYGHDIGDKVLTSLAKILQTTVRSSDSVGRWGGEEFIVLLPNTGIEKAYALIERMRKEIAAEQLQFGHRRVSTSISCGIASTKFSSSFEGLLKAADISLYEAKEQGRNCTRPQIKKAS